MNTTTMPWRKLVQTARNEPKKAGILTVLVVVMAGAWARLMTGSPAPQAAAGSPVARPGLAVTAGAAASRTLAAPATQPLQQWLQSPVVPLGRNLFVVRLDAFPIDPAARPGANNGAKSIASQADQEKQRQILIENLQTQAAQLRLQSTMMSAVPKALINGEMVREGDVVASFRVLRIEARRIVVEREGIRLEIHMK